MLHLIVPVRVPLPRRSATTWSHGHCQPLRTAQPPLSLSLSRSLRSLPTFTMREGMREDYSWRSSRHPQPQHGRLRSAYVGRASEVSVPRHQQQNKKANTFSHSIFPSQGLLRSLPPSVLRLSLSSPPRPHLIYLSILTRPGGRAMHAKHVL